MGTGAPSNSNRRKNPSQERKRRKKATRMAKSSKRRRHNSPSPSSRSDHSSTSAFSSDSEGGSGGASHDRTTKKEALVRQQRLPGRDGGSSRHQKKKKKKKKKRSYQGERDSKRRDSRSKLSEGNHQKKGHDRRRRRRSRSRSTSIGSLDKYSSWSCSTCRSCSSSPERTKSDRSLRSKGKALKVRSSARGRSSSRREKEMGGMTRSRRRHGYRSSSPSCSSCSRCSHEGRSRNPVRGSGSESHHDEGRLAEKSHSRLPLSTSTVVKHPNEIEDRYCSGKDGNKVDIIQDFDDLHTSRSNDSYDWERKRDSGMSPPPSTQNASERRRHSDSSGGTGRNGHANDAEADLKRDISSSVIVTGPDDGAQWGNQNDLQMRNNAQPRLKSQVSTSGGGFEADELELLLRQKALENFKKFRARISTNANSVGEHKYESIPIKAHEVTTGKSEAAQFRESARPITLPVKQKSYTSIEHHTSANDESLLLQFVSISDANAPALACSPVEKTERNNKKLMQQHPGDTMITKIVRDRSFSNSDPCSEEFQAESSGKIFGEDLSSKNMSDKKNSAKAGDADIHKKEGNRVDVSASTDTSCHKSASEFEQKTMSVMHGGEVVQVSYKVYIPKKTPALARRRLQH